MSVFVKLSEAGCQMDNHYSDLYVKGSPIAESILQESEVSFSVFISQVDGQRWFEVPFAFDPFWDKVGNVSK